MPATSVIFDQTRPARLGNGAFGTMTGFFIDSATGGTLYTDAVAAVQGHFKVSPPPRVVYVATNVTNGYAFIATGHV